MSWPFEIVDLPERADLWVQSEALQLCKLVESICPAFGCHVALTGGLLYKDGPRKDCDLVLYRIRQVKAIDLKGLFDRLEHVGIKRVADHNFVLKATYRGKGIDFLIPEATGGEYPPIA